MGLGTGVQLVWSVSIGQIMMFTGILGVLSYLVRIHRAIVLFSAEHEVLMLDFYDRHPEYPRPLHYGGGRGSQQGSLLSRAAKVSAGGGAYGNPK